MKALARNILISVVMLSAAVVTAQQPSDQPAAPPQNNSNKITVRDVFAANGKITF
jgi:hypothetical protein